MATKKPTRKAALQFWKGKKDKKFYWHFVQSNGRITAVGGEGYNRRNDMLRTIRNMGLKLKEGAFEMVEVPA